MQAIALEQHLRTKALEIFPTFIVGIDLKDKLKKRTKMGEMAEIEPQNHRSVARLLEGGGIFFRRHN